MRMIHRVWEIQEIVSNQRCIVSLDEGKIAQHVFHSSDDVE